MGCLFYLIFWPFLMIKWSAITGFYMIKFMVYGFLAFIALILQLFGVKSPSHTSYHFGDIKNELTKIDVLDGIEFEHYIANLLNELGYSNITVNQASGDYGVDVVATKNGIKYAFQCKRYSSKVSNNAVQEVVAGMTFHGCSQGIVVTNNYFTKNAIELAFANNVELWDRDKLSKLIGQVHKAKLEPINKNKPEKEKTSKKLDNLTKNNLIKKINTKDTLIDNKHVLSPVNNETFKKTNLTESKENNPSISLINEDTGNLEYSKLIGEENQSKIVSKPNEINPEQILSDHSIDKEEIIKSKKAYVAPKDYSNLKLTIKKTLLKLSIFVPMFSIIFFIVALNIKDPLIGSITIVLSLFLSIFLSHRFIENKFNIKKLRRKKE